MGFSPIADARCKAWSSCPEQNPLGEHVGRQFGARRFEPLGTRRPNARGDKLAMGLALDVDALLLIRENLLLNNNVAFHADHLGHAGDLARAALQAVGLDDELHRGHDLPAHRLDWQIDARHQHHRFEPRQGISC